eukprot:scaffold1905_cov48-Attheya_sp.AAC.1
MEEGLGRNSSSNANNGPASSKEMNLLSVTRKVTFRATLSTFFGVDSCDLSHLDIQEDKFIEAIVAYFKAWEYFLFRREYHWHDGTVKEHSDAVSNLGKHVRHLLQVTDKAFKQNTCSPSHKNLLFVDQLRKACKGKEEEELLLEQSALEMLLAGTDTSSVTAYYALLGIAGPIAGDEEFQRDLRTELCNGESVLLNRLVDETLRFKPVGPVVLREAVAADPNFPGIAIKEGAAILVHLAEMNMRKENWHDPRTFNPRRSVDSADMARKFFPFGQGPKGCIGMHLGRREVKAIVETVVSNYNMSIEGSETLSSLETRWDIANQPDTPIYILVGRRE